MRPRASLEDGAPDGLNHIGLSSGQLLLPATSGHRDLHIVSTYIWLICKGHILREERTTAMDVKTLCLGVLTEGNKSGYEIKRCFEEAFSHFFFAGFGSIYPALAELSRAGLVTCENVEQEGRPDKKVYSLTPAGERSLIDELLITPPRHKVRSEFLVLMYFAHLLPPTRLAAIIDERIAEWERAVAGIEGCCASDDAHASPGMRFAAGYGRAVIGAALAYVRANKAGLVQEVAGTVDPERLVLTAN